MIEIGIRFRCDVCCVAMESMSIAPRMPVSLRVQVTDLPLGWSLVPAEPDQPSGIRCPEHPVEQPLIQPASGADIRAVNGTHHG